MADDWDPEEHYRESDPDTSAQAAEEVTTVIRHKRALMRVHVMALFNDSFGYQGFTPLECSLAAGLGSEAGHKRVSDLLRDGLLRAIKAEDMPLPPGHSIDRHGYICRRNPTGRNAQVMVPTEEGIAWARQQGLLL